VLTPAKFGVLISVVVLCAGCDRGPPPQNEATTATPVTPDAGPQAPVEVGPQVAAGEPTDYQIVMDSLKETRVAPAGTAPDWSEVAARPLQVEKMGCVSELGVPPHCHMIVEKDQQHHGVFLPDRRLVIIETTPGNYLVTITSEARPDQVIACPVLKKVPNNPQTIKGMCAVTMAPDNKVVHNFAATIKKRLDGTIRVHFAYRHKDFDSPDDPVHNGDGHAQ
jgi:hypothetical protein